MCNFTCEKSPGIFHTWNFTCENAPEKLSHVKFYMWFFACDIPHVRSHIWLIRAIWYVTFPMWNFTSEISHGNFSKWNFTWWEKSHKKYCNGHLHLKFLIWIFLWDISHACGISHVKSYMRLLLGSYSCNFSHAKFHMWYFTCEKTHVKFLISNFTCDISYVKNMSNVIFPNWIVTFEISAVKFHMWNEITCEIHGCWDSPLVLELHMWIRC